MERQGIRLLLVSGQMVEAVQDCGCLNHVGPHWLYMNDLWRERNRKMLDAGNPRGFLHEDHARVKEKLFYMKRQGIVEIVR